MKCLHSLAEATMTWHFCKAIIVPLSGWKHEILLCYLIKENNFMYRVVQEIVSTSIISWELLLILYVAAKIGQFWLVGGKNWIKKRFKQCERGDFVKKCIVSAIK